jgi:hypothetical protein
LNLQGNSVGGSSSNSEGKIAFGSDIGKQDALGCGPDNEAD